MNYNKRFTDVGSYTRDDMDTAKVIYKVMSKKHNTKDISVRIRRELRCDGEKARVLMYAAKFYYDMKGKGMI